MRVGLIVAVVAALCLGLWLGLRGAPEAPVPPPAPVAPAGADAPPALPLSRLPEAPEPPPSAPSQSPGRVVEPVPETPVFDDIDAAELEALNRAEAAADELEAQLESLMTRLEAVADDPDARARLEAEIERRLTEFNEQVLENLAN